MRNKYAFINMMANLMLQVCVAVSGIILPRFFMEAYGSTVNGMITSISQFLSYIALVEAGVGTASAVVLYAPLANKDSKQINGILSATKRFYFKSGCLYLILTLGLAVIYPMLINSQVEKSLVVLMVLILSSSSAIDFFVLGKYRVLLTADQKNYVVTFAQIIGTILMVVLSVLFIKLNMGVVVVKSVVTFVFILRVLIVYVYVKKKYSDVNYNEVPMYDKLEQRWDALLHQIVGTIVLNTGIVILTVFSGKNSLLEVSVYTTYNMVGQALYLFLNSFSTALSAGFGQVIAAKEEETLKKAYSTYEYMYTIVLHIMYTCMAILILPFVYLYTINIKDVNYVRVSVAILFVVCGYIRDMRIPSLTMICSAGHFRETRYRAIAEALINIVVSMIFVFKFGLVGVLAGTICSFAYRSIDCVLYNSKYIVKNISLRFMRRMLVNLSVSMVLIVVGIKFVNVNMDSFFEWFVNAGICAVMCSVVICIVNCVSEPEEFKNLLIRVKSLVRK